MKQISLSINKSSLEFESTTQMARAEERKKQKEINLKKQHNNIPPSGIHKPTSSGNILNPNPIPLANGREREKEQKRDEENFHNTHTPNAHQRKASPNIQALQIQPHAPTNTGGGINNANNLNKGYITVNSSEVESSANSSNLAHNQDFQVSKSSHTKYAKDNKLKIRNGKKRRANKGREIKT